MAMHCRQLLQEVMDRLCRCCWSTKQMSMHRGVLMAMHCRQLLKEVMHRLCGCC